MHKLSGLCPNSVFKYFEEICAIPHGSGDTERISAYCMDFAKAHSLKAVCDETGNVIIYKDATKGYEKAEPIILQGHLDMVCQKTEDSHINFETDGLDIYIDGDFIKAKGTTLGADNGIAVAMIMAILSRDDIPHPPIEAVFTTNEETGMFGALALSTKGLKAKRMINLDSEEDDTVTVSCAGGSDFVATLLIKRTEEKGRQTVLTIKGLKGGHSGIEINSNRVNANILMGRVLSYLKTLCKYDIIEINGGDKANAIPNCCTVRLIAEDSENFKSLATDYLEVIKREITSKESGFAYSLITAEQEENRFVLDKKTRDTLLYLLLMAPNGVIDMSADIEGLVETSLNLGILKTETDGIVFNFALRSNKQSALEFLEKRLNIFFSAANCSIETSAHYPPWEFNEDSELQKIYKDCFFSQFGFKPKVEAIHAGLECGVFASKIQGLDCISIGPRLFDVHTVSEKLSIPSTAQIFDLVLCILKNCK